MSLSSGTRIKERKKTTETQSALDLNKPQVPIKLRTVFLVLDLKVEPLWSLVKSRSVSSDTLTG